MKEQFNQDANTCIEALNRLLQSEYICMNDKYMMRINRFKRWVIDITNETTRDNNN